MENLNIIPFPSKSLKVASALADLSISRACTCPSSAAFIKGVRPC